MTLLEIVLAGVLGNLVGSWIAYAAGYYGRIELLDRNRLIHVNQKHLATADRWFERHGDATVFFTRMLPIIRTFISLPAGIARMPFWRFTVLTVAGCVPWVDHLHYLDYAVLAAIVVGVAYLLVRRRRSNGGSGAREAGADAGAAAREAGP
jgi:membrane protein DedA with SNARE-associated domain